MVKEQQRHNDKEELEYLRKALAETQACLTRYRDRPDAGAQRVNGAYLLVRRMVMSYLMQSPLPHAPTKEPLQRQRRWPKKDELCRQLEQLMPESLIKTENPLTKENVWSLWR